ncbi:hypothetical protein ACFQL1_15895 [Halomicroarcula sp. GCM10025709]|uniref:hypothetical protein n=1 Tax=Halomicroarcula sp. GCM10025709 TaxID=3252669 RepID=UPI0036071C66
MPTDQWDRFEASAGRSLEDLGFEDNINVYEPTETSSPGDGIEITYPDNPTATITGGTEPPPRMPTRTAAGSPAPRT